MEYYDACFNGFAPSDDVARRKSAERLEEELANEARARAEREARRKRLEAKYNMDLGNDISDEASPAQ